ncbi:hypothetical protein BDW62DRAFT_181525 [Aspergillus aurantiobrunneus]
MPRKRFLLHASTYSPFPRLRCFALPSYNFLHISPNPPYREPSVFTLFPSLLYLADTALPLF